MVDFNKMTKERRKKKNILIIQPHSDDVVFSASKFLKVRDSFDEFIILTVETDERRLEEDRAVCEEFNVQLLTLETIVSSEGFHKEYYSDKKLMSDDSAFEFCANKIGDSKLLKLADELEELLTAMKDDFLIVTCLGVGHPFHWLVRTLTEKHSDLFYRDFPHSYKRRNKDYFNGLVSTKFKLKETHDIERRNKNDWQKFDVVKIFYKSQSSLLFFEKNYMDKMLPEEFYEKVKN